MALASVFFFQAEDGIRGHCVTGVQTCALPICRHIEPASHAMLALYTPDDSELRSLLATRRELRSEERRVGKECRSGTWGEDEQKQSMSADPMSGRGTDGYGWVGELTCNFASSP